LPGCRGSFFILKEKNMFHDILTGLFPRNGRPRRKAVHARRLTLESLEDRSVPAILVDTLVDEVSANGSTSLREAIAQAQATPSDDTIEFADGLAGTINLAQGELLLGHLFMPPNSGSLTIDGGGGVTIDAGGRSGVMEVQSGTVILTGLTFTNGSSDLGGGLMIWDRSNVTLANSQVSANTATSAGGGIFNGGVLTMTDTVVSHNDSKNIGGGVYIYGQYGGGLTATGSTFSDNSARNAGGGIFNSGGVLMLADSFLVHNVATRVDGGGIYNSGGVVTLSGTTVNSNTARNGGGIYNDGGHLSVSSSTTNRPFNNNVASGKGNDIYYTVGSFDPPDDLILDVYAATLKTKGSGRK
jgi:hypothetical protein